MMRLLRLSRLLSWTSSSLFKEMFLIVSLFSSNYDHVTIVVSNDASCRGMKYIQAVA